MIPTTKPPSQQDTFETITIRHVAIFCPSGEHNEVLEPGDVMVIDEEKRTIRIRKANIDGEAVFWMVECYKIEVGAMRKKVVKSEIVAKVERE